MTTAPAPIESASITLTAQEAQALIGLLDTAVKAAGLQAAANALVFLQRLQVAFAPTAPTEPTIVK